MKQIKNIFEIPSLIGQEFQGQPILVDEKLIADFAQLTGDSNKHLKKENNSIFGGVVCSSMLATSLMANHAAGIWNIFQIDEPYELIANKLTDTTYLRPILAESEIQFTFSLVSASPCVVHKLNSVKTTWSVTTMNTRDKKCVMRAQWVTTYVSTSRDM